MIHVQFGVKILYIHLLNFEEPKAHQVTSNTYRHHLGCVRMISQHEKRAFTQFKLCIYEFLESDYL